MCIWWGDVEWRLAAGARTQCDITTSRSTAATRSVLRRSRVCASLCNILTKSRLLLANQVRRWSLFLYREVGLLRYYLYYVAFSVLRIFVEQQNYVVGKNCCCCCCLLPLQRCGTRNLAIANRSRVSCAHNTFITLRASVVTSWPWNLG